MLNRILTKKYIILIPLAILMIIGTIIFILQADLVAESDINYDSLYPSSISLDMDVYDDINNSVLLYTSTPLEIQALNLQKLSMVWGFAKYTRMAFLTGEKCWDEELINLIPIVQFAHPDDVNDILYNWFVGLGYDGYDNNGVVLLRGLMNDILLYTGLDSSQFTNLMSRVGWLSFIPFGYSPNGIAVGFLLSRDTFMVIDENDANLGWLHSLEELDIFGDNSHLKSLVDMSWIADESFLGSQLANVLTRFRQISIVDRTNAPVFFTQGFSDFSNKNLHVGMDFEDERYRLLGLFRLWNTLKYFYPNIDIIDYDWNEVLLNHIPRMLEANDRLSYELALISLATRINDPHILFINNPANNDTRQATADHILGQFVAPAILTVADDYLVVEQIIMEGYADELFPGDIVLRVNGLDVNHMGAEVLNYIAHAGDGRTLLWAANVAFLLRQHEPDAPMGLSIIRDGIEMEVSITAVDRHAYVGYFIAVRLATPSVGFEVLDNNIGLINPAALHPGSIPVIMNNYLRDTNGIIIDLRQILRHSGFIHGLAPYFVEDMQLFAQLTFASQFIPGVFANWYRPYAGGGSAGDNDNIFLYENNVVVLMNERTFSSPEYAVMALRNGSNVTVMGINSAGSNGDVRSLPLPGNIRMYFTSLGVFTSEGGQTHRIGLPPDIYVHRTVAGVRDGRDELMEAAIAFLLG